MVGLSKVILALGLAMAASAGMQNADAVPTVNILTDSGTLISTTHAAPSSTSVQSVARPYGTSDPVFPYTITQVYDYSGVVPIGYKLTFYPTSGFGTGSVNNLAGGRTVSFAGLLAFDIDFGVEVNLTTNVFESGTYAASGNGRVAVNSADLPSGVQVSQLDDLRPNYHEMISNSFLTSAVVSPFPVGVGHSLPANTAGDWFLYDQLTGFSRNYRKYHVVIDNDLLAESVPGDIPGFASIAKRNFSIVFTFDGSGGDPFIPEPASLGILALGTLSLLASRRRPRH